MADAEDGRRRHDACMLSYGARKDLGEPDLACGAGCGGRLRGALAVHQPQRKRAALNAKQVGPVSGTAQPDDNAHFPDQHFMQAVRAATHCAVVIVQSAWVTSAALRQCGTLGRLLLKTEQMQKCTSCDCCFKRFAALLGSLHALRLHRRLATDSMDSSTLRTATMLAESSCSSRKRP